MAFLKVLTFIALAASTSAAEGGCTREALVAARESFWKAATGGEPKGLAQNVKIALNNKPVTSLAQTPYAQIKSSTWTNFLVQTVDTEICQIAFFKVSTQQLLSTRLALDASGAISEVEFLQAVQGDQFFRPTGFPTTAPAMFNEKQQPAPAPQIPAQWTPAGGMFDHKASVSRQTCKATSGTPRPWSRRELIYAASSYCDGL